MQRWMRTGFGLCAAAGLAMGAAPARGANPPAYAITASNVTMPSNGNGQTQFTVTGIPSTGTLVMSCSYSGPQTTAKLPLCAGGPVFEFQVTAGQTVKGTIAFAPYSNVVPASRQRRHGPEGPLAWAGLLVVLVGLRRRLRAGIFRTLLLAVALAGVAGMAACGGNSNATTPGTYAYTITADNEGNPTEPLGQGVSTTIQVTVM